MHFLLHFSRTFHCQEERKQGNTPRLPSVNQITLPFQNLFAPINVHTEKKEVFILIHWCKSIWERICLPVQINLNFLLIRDWIFLFLRGWVQLTYLGISEISEIVPHWWKLDKTEIFGFVENWKARNMEKHNKEQSKLGEGLQVDLFENWSWG